MSWTQTCFTEAYVQILYVVTLTSDIVIWFLHATHGLVMIIISAKYFLNPTMQYTEL